MRELEQEKFREYCQTNGIGAENAVEIASNEEEEEAEENTSANKQSETITST